MAGTREDRLVAMPAGAGKILLERGGIHLCGLLKTKDFAKFSTERGLRVNEERLLTLERLGLFSPLVRLRTPDEERPHLGLPLKDAEWFDRGWAIDTAIGGDHWVPDQPNDDSEAYYSRFQIASLDFVLSEYNLTMQLEKCKRCPPPTFRPFVSREIPHGLMSVREFLHGRSIGASHK